MMTVAQKQEQYLLDARGYANALASLGLVEPNDVRDNYTVTTSYVGGSSRTYFIQAVPKGRQTEDSCGTLSLDNTGQKLPVTERCW
jgi:type IV pilus assembly protein PilE